MIVKQLLQELLRLVIFQVLLVLIADVLLEGGGFFEPLGCDNSLSVGIPDEGYGVLDASPLERLSALGAS